MPTLALIGLGSNQGDRRVLLDQAVVALAESPGVILRGVSRYRETPPVGGPGGQSPFLNAAAALETTLGPEDLLVRLHEIEARAGRVREVHWGERTLDLDLLLFGDEVRKTPRLQLPHPRMAFRRFVLAPLAEVAAEAREPVTGRTVADLLANLDRRPSLIALACKPREDWRRSPHLEGLELPLLQGLTERLRAVSIGPQWSPVLTQRTADPFGLNVNAMTPRGLPENVWRITPRWFDTQYLEIDSLKTLRMHHRRFFDRFLEARAQALPATFVVARPVDVAALGLQDPRYDWRRPIGWDTPVLPVSDFDSEAAIQEVVVTCAMTRSG